MYPETVNAQYYTLRDTVSTADNSGADFTAAQKTWAHYEATYSDAIGNGLSKRLSPRANAVQIIFDFKNVDADTATFVIYAYRPGGPAEFVCSGNLTAGAQPTDDSTTRYYADTIASLTQRWLKPVAKIDASANNGVAKIAFDSCGYEYFVCLFTAISSNDNVRAKISWL